MAIDELVLFLLLVELVVWFDADVVFAFVCDELLLADDEEFDALVVVVVAGDVEGGVETGGDGVEGVVVLVVGEAGVDVELEGA